MIILMRLAATKEQIDQVCDVIRQHGVEPLVLPGEDRVAIGIPAALNRPAEVVSRCEQSKETLHLTVGLDGPEPSDWLFQCEVPAAKWWQDIVFT